MYKKLIEAWRKMNKIWSNSPPGAGYTIAASSLPPMPPTYQTISGCITGTLPLRPGGAYTTNYPGAVRPLSPPVINTWPYMWDQLSDQEMKLIKDFKLRHPDFETLSEEVEIICKYRPGLRGSPLFISLVYELATNIKKLIEDSTKDQTIEEIVDGKNEETTGP